MKPEGLCCDVAVGVEDWNSTVVVSIKWSIGSFKNLFANAPT
jgi:hypothetical protein